MTTLHILRDDPVDTMVITLDPPIGWRGGEIAELRLKEPTARQVRDAEREYSSEAPWAGTVAYELRLIGAVSGLSAPALEHLPIGASNYAAAFLQEFVEAGAPDGEDEPGEGEAPEPVTLPIEPPITFLGTSYADLELREPLASEIRKARQLMRSAGSLFESRRAQMLLVANVSGLPPPVIDALPIRTLNAASRVLGRFTLAGRRTGKP